MFFLQLIITIGTVFCANDKTAKGKKGSWFLSSNILYLLVEMYRCWAMTSVSILCGCCLRKTMLTLNWMIDSGCDFLGCILYCIYSNQAPTSFVLFIVCTLLKLLMNFLVFLDGCKEQIDFEREGKKLACKDICSNGCGAFIGGANGAMGIGYGFFAFLGAVIASPDSIFNSNGFLLVVQIHVFITTTYMYAKLDNIIDESYLQKRTDWMFPQFDNAQAFDVLAYFKFEMVNLVELIIYCIVILIFMIVGIDDEAAKSTGGWVYYFGIAAAICAICFLLFVMVLIRKLDSYRKGLSDEDKAKISGESLTKNGDPYGAPKIMAVA